MSLKFLPIDDPNFTRANAPGVQDNPPPLETFVASTLADRPVPQRLWHVQDMIPANTVTLFGGDGATGKSLLAQQLAVATATGSSWIGIPVDQGPCLFLTAEDDRDELHRRLNDIAQESGESIDRMTDLHMLSLAGKDALLAVPEGKTNILRPTPIFRGLELAIQRIRPRLVILDTLADLFGGEENQRSQARQFIGMLRGVALKHECSVLMLAHPSLSGMASGSGTSGSTGWNNSVRSRLYLERVKDEAGSESDPDARQLKVMKANYSRTGNEIKLRWNQGMFVATSNGSAGQAGISVAAAQDRANKIFIELLAAYESEGRNVAATGPTFAPTIFARDARSHGVSRRGLTDAMNRLFASQRIEIIEEGPPSHRRKRLAFRKARTEH
jgi:RecA-family ATPase